MSINRVAGLLLCCIVAIGSQTPWATADPSGGSTCCSAQGTPGCDDLLCETIVCGCDPFCCDSQWDELCATIGFEEGCGAGLLCLSCSICGNGVLQLGEECDDGNIAGGDGCSAGCLLEPTGACCANSACQVLSEVMCNSLGGLYQGDEVSCTKDDTQVYWFSPGLPIPDNSPAGVSQTFNVAASGQVVDVNVELAIMHTWIGDLCVSLVHDGVTIPLVQRPGEPAPGCTVNGFGCPCNSLQVTLDDEGAGGSLEGSITNCASDGSVCSTPAAGYAPVQPLSLFDGLDSSGDWILTVSDYQQQDVGIFVSWSLILTTTGLTPADCQGCRANADCNDNNACTFDVCNLTTGECSNFNAPAGKQCGSQADTLCDNPDSCDGAGQCLAMNEPDGTSCTSDGNDCTTDACTAGDCGHANVPVDTPCGSDADTECDAPDACDGAGQCLANHMPNGTLCSIGECAEGVCEIPPDCVVDADCGDTDPCTLDVCTAGKCSHPPAPAGTACGSNSDTECDNPDTCNGAGACMTNPAADGTACAPDSNPCTSDVCTGGACAHQPVAAGTPCGSNADTDCDNPDSCNAAGQCQANNASNGTVCTDGNACTAADTCQAGVCKSGPATDCDDDDGCTVDSCNPAVGCLHSPAFCPEGRICVDGLCIPVPQCQADVDCDDDDPCTQDRCVESNCRSSSIPDCCVDDSDCPADEQCDVSTSTCEPRIGPAEPEPPLPPSGVAATDGTSTAHVRITWNAAALADDYRVYRCDDGVDVETCSALTNWIAGTTYDDLVAVEGVIYYYRVKARNEDGESDFSAADPGSRAEESTEPTDECTADAECDDGLYCNGAETCSAGQCAAGQSPCSDDQTCDESTDSCTDPAEDTCGAGLGCAPQAPFLGLLLFSLLGLRRSVRLPRRTGGRTASPYRAARRS